MAELADACSGRVLTRGELSQARKAADARGPERIWGACALAAQARLQRGDPFAALRLVSPLVLPAGTSPPPVTGDAHAIEAWVWKLPPATDWRIDAEAGPALAEWMLALAQAGAAQAALDRIRVLADTGADMTAVRLLHAAGGILADAHRSRDALESLRYALRRFGDAIPLDSGSGQPRPLTAQEALLKSAITRTIDDVQRQVDRETLGEAFVAFRAADARARVPDVRWQAVALYAEVATRFADTPFAGAARMGRIRLLFSLAAPRAAQEADATRATLRARLSDEDRARQRELALLPPDAPLAIQLRAAGAAAAATAAGWADIPTGPAAATAALAAIRQAGAQDRTYLGEMLAEQAAWTLAQRGDGAAAAALCARALEWIANQPATGDPQAMASVPEAARIAAGAPAGWRTTDPFGNSDYSAIAPGVVINQATCSWYLPMLSMRMRMLGGLAWFVAGDRAKADAWWKESYAIDPQQGIDEARGWGSAYQRLNWDLRFQRGGLYATDAEMAAFKDPRRRIRVLLADLAIEADDHARAADQFRSLLAGDYGELSANETGYCAFALGVCLSYLHDRSGATAQFARFDEELARTPSCPRALHQRAKTILSGLHLPASELAVAKRLHQRLQKEFRSTDDADVVAFDIAWYHDRSGYPPEAAAGYRDYLVAYPGGLYAGRAKHRLMELAGRPPTD